MARYPAQGSAHRKISPSYLSYIPLIGLYAVVVAVLLALIY